MRMQTETSPAGVQHDGGAAVRHTVTFTEIGPEIPDVTLILDRLEFDGGSIDSGITRVVIEGSMLTAVQVAEVAQIMPRLVAMAYNAVAPELPAFVQADLIAGAQDVGISGEIARAASIYRDALADGRLPLKAVMKELNLTKPTASRRIRAARDMGLIPEKGEQ